MSSITYDQLAWDLEEITLNQLSTRKYAEMKSKLLARISEDKDGLSHTVHADTKALFIRLVRDVREGRSHYQVWSATRKLISALHAETRARKELTNKRAVDMDWVKGCYETCVTHGLKFLMINGDATEALKQLAEQGLVDIGTMRYTYCWDKNHNQTSEVLYVVVNIINKVQPETAEELEEVLKDAEKTHFHCAKYSRVPTDVITKTSVHALLLMLRECHTKSIAHLDDHIKVSMSVFGVPCCYEISNRALMLLRGCIK